MMMNNVFNLIMSSQRRKETMKKLVIKYQLRGRFFEKCEEDNLSGDDTTDDKKGKAGKKESSQFIEENIKLLKRLVDRQTKELAKLNEMMDT